MTVEDRHPGRMEIEEIMAHLPHRYPLLLVDRILELEPGQPPLRLWQRVRVTMGK